MLIKRVRNLTEEDIWIYGTSGRLIKLPSRPFALIDVKYNGRLLEPERDMYYIPDEKILQKLEEDWRYQPRIAYQKFAGSGREGQSIYTLSDHLGNKLEFITDGVLPNDTVFIDVKAKKAKGEVYLKYNRFPSGTTVSKVESN